MPESVLYSLAASTVVCLVCRPTVHLQVSSPCATHNVQPAPACGIGITFVTMSSYSCLDCTLCTAERTQARRGSSLELAGRDQYLR